MRPLGRPLIRPKADDDRDDTTAADVLPVVALGRDDTTPTLIISDTKDGARVIPPSSSCDATGGLAASAIGNAPSTQGSATSLSMLSDLPNLAVGNDVPAESAIVVQSLRPIPCASAQVQSFTDRSTVYNVILPCSIQG